MTRLALLLATLATSAAAQEAEPRDWRVRAWPSAAPEMARTHPEPMTKDECLWWVTRYTGRAVLIQWHGEPVYSHLVATCVKAGEPA